MTAEEYLVGILMGECIPYFEGDCIAWGFIGEERYKRSNEEQKETINRINQKNSWIVEGTYSEIYKTKDWL